MQGAQAFLLYTVTVLEDEWWAIPQRFIQKLIMSMHERLKRCKAKNGNRFKKVI
jgi:hypothetical protein